MSEERDAEIRRLIQEAGQLPVHATSQQAFDFTCKLLRICQLEIADLGEKLGELTGKMTELEQAFAETDRLVRELNEAIRDD